ncbi:MAG: asparagine synthase (glutamine-hydrolyzing) [Mariniphaga sp.]
MCGINGIYSTTDIVNIDKRIKAMNDSISHRGPDAKGSIVLSNKVSLGHRRLSIIDLDERSNQPMFSIDKKYVIVFNGEILNFADIKSELVNEYTFKTKSDTEVILASYIIKGIDWFLKKANGMYAFALHNIETGELILARDRFGIKPLFYTIVNETLIFSSEIKGILNSGLVEVSFNFAAVDEYLGNRFVREPFTFFNNIFQVKSASYLLFSNKIESIEKTYWILPKLNFDESYDEISIINETEKQICEAVNRWLIADVKVGAYLSGGVDSSLMTALLTKYINKQIDTYTIGFLDKGFNEFEFAQVVAKRYFTNHREFILEPSNYFDELERLIGYKDAPLGVPNEVPLATMSTNLSNDITVVISGEGADELFGGYGRIFRSAFDFKNHNKNIKNVFYYYFISLYEYVNRDTRDKYLKNEQNYRSYFDNELITDFILHKNEENIFRFFHTYHIKGLLNRLDMTTMQTSVEARPPFLDYKLIEFVYQHVPYSLKLKWIHSDSESNAEHLYSQEYSEKLDIPKYILKVISEKYLPKEIIYRKKMGFPVPLTTWFVNLENMAKNLLNNTDWLNENVVDELCAELKGSDRAGQMLWMFINIEIFKRKYFNKNWTW